MFRGPSLLELKAIRLPSGLQTLSVLLPSEVSLIFLSWSTSRIQMFWSSSSYTANLWSLGRGEAAGTSPCQHSPTPSPVPGGPPRRRSPVTERGAVHRQAIPQPKNQSPRLQLSWHPRPPTPEPTHQSVRGCQDRKAPPISLLRHRQCVRLGRNGDYRPRGPKALVLLSPGRIPQSATRNHCHYCRGPPCCLARTRAIDVQSGLRCPA